MCLTDSNIRNIVFFDVDWRWFVGDICWDGLPAGVAAPNIEIVSRSQRCKHVPTSSYLGDRSRGQVLESSDKAGLVRRASWRYFTAETRGVPLIAQGVDITCARKSREPGLVGHELLTWWKLWEDLALILVQESVERLVPADRAIRIKNCLFVDVSFDGPAQIAWPVLCVRLIRLMPRRAYSWIRTPCPIAVGEPWVDSLQFSLCH